MDKKEIEYHLNDIRGIQNRLINTANYLGICTEILAKYCDLPYDLTVTKGHIINFERVKERVESALFTLQENAREGDDVSDLTIVLADMITNEDDMLELLDMLDELFA